MEVNIDARGKECPTPIQMTLQALESPDLHRIRILVDQQSTAEGIADFLESQGFAVQMSDHEDAIAVGGRRDPDATASPETAPAGGGRSVLVLVADDRIGADARGERLMARFLETLDELRPDLRWVIFLNAGVKWAVEPGETLETLKALAADGVRIGVRGGCLKHFGMDGRNAVGEILRMREILVAMQRADKVIRI
jgi:selenium metabolism protein YedF